MKHILILSGLLALSGAANAATLTAGPSCTFSTIQAAIDAASPGDTVQLCTNSSAYTESFNINTAITLDLNGQWIDWTNFTGNYAGWSNDSNRFGGFGGIVPGQVGLNPCTASGSCGIAQPTQWLPNTAYAAQVTETYNEISMGVWPLITSVVNGSSPSRNYYVVTPGTSASSGGPTGTGSSITDGTVVWAYKQNYQGATIKNGFLTGAGINFGGFASLGCIRANSEGLLNITNVAFIGCQVGVDYSNYKNSKLTIQDSVLYNNGLSYIAPPGATGGSGCANCFGGGGNSHNMYITDIAELDLTRVVTTEATEGRTVKFRGNTLNMTNVITGSVYGGALNYPNGGLATVTGSGGGSIWISPASGNEKQLMTYADERYVGNDGVRRVSASNLISNTSIVIRQPVINLGFISPYYGTVTFDGTNTWYNVSVPVVPTDGPASRVIGVPTSTTGTILTRAQMDTGIATDTASMTAPIQAVAAFAALLLYYDVNVPPWQASAASLGYTGPSGGDTITVATHPNFSAAHGVPYVAIATGDYPGTAAPLATFTCSNTTLQNVEFGGAGGLGGGIADIDWGDSSPKRPDNFITATGGTNVPFSQNQTTGGTLTVYGAHTYATAGSYTVTITIHELSPGTGTVTTTLTATVS